MNMNINTDLLQKSNMYKDALQKTQAIFESQQSEIEYFQKNHIPWITKAQNIYAIDLNEKYLIFAEGNVAFLSKDIVNESEVWDWIKSAGKTAGEWASNVGTFFIGAGKHAINAIGEMFPEIYKLISTGKADISKIILGFAGLMEIIALLSAFIPKISNIMGVAFGILGGLLFIIAGLMELNSSTDKITKENISESILEKYKNGIMHVTMGTVSIALTGVSFLVGGATFSIIKNSVEKLLKLMWAPIQKVINSIGKKVISHSLEHNIEHFGTHYMGAFIAYAFGKGMKKMNESENNANQKSVSDIISVNGFQNTIKNTTGKLNSSVTYVLDNIKKVFNFNEKLRSWASEFFNNLKKNIDSTISKIQETASKILEFLKNVNILIQYYIKEFISMKIEYGTKGEELFNIFKNSEDGKDSKKLEVLKNKASEIKEKIGKNDKGQNIQYVGKVKFDSNKITKKKDDKGNEYLVVTDLKTKKKYGVIRTKDGKYAFRKKTNESKIYENNRQSKNGLLSFDEFLIENLNFNI